jgi:enoyl-CoA hydratase/carnithine racemase
MVSANYGDVHVALSGATAVVEIRRPPHNFFDAPLIKCLADAFKDIDADPQARAILLCSEGRSFCAGHDFKGDSSDEARREARGMLYAGALQMFACDTPVVAAIQGAAIGGGLGLAMVGDFRMAAAEAKFAAPFVKLGLSPGFGLTYTLPRTIGEQKAALLTYTGRRIDGQVAFDWGLVDELVPADRLRAAALALADEIAAAAPLAVVASRRALRRGLAEEVRLAMDRESADQQFLSATLDCAEGTRAAMEKRDARFVGQ